MRRLGRLAIILAMVVALAGLMAFSAQAAGLIPIGSSLNWHPFNVPGTFPFAMNFGDTATTGNLQIATVQVPTAGGGEWDEFFLQTTDGSTIASNINANWNITFDYFLSQAVIFDGVESQWTVGGTPVNPVSDIGGINQPGTGPLGYGFVNGYGTLDAMGNPLTPFNDPIAAGPFLNWQQVFVDPYNQVSSGGIDPNTADGFNFALHFTPQSPVPLPGTLPLVLSGLGVLVAWRRRFNS